MLRFALLWVLCSIVSLVSITLLRTGIPTAQVCAPLFFFGGLHLIRRWWRHFQP